MSSPLSGAPDWLVDKQVLVDAIHAVFEGQKLDSLSVRLLGIVDQVNDLIVPNPSVGMEDEVEHPFFYHGSIEGGFHVGHGYRIVGLVQVLSLPVAGNHARELPAPFPNDVRVRVVFDCVDERGKRNVLVHLGVAITVDHQVPRQFGVPIGKNIEDTTVSLQVISCGGSAVENLTPQSRTGGVAGIAARRSKCDWTIAANR